MASLLVLFEIKNGEPNTQNPMTKKEAATISGKDKDLNNFNIALMLHTSII